MIHKLHEEDCLSRVTIYYGENLQKQIAFCPYCGVTNENTATGSWGSWGSEVPKLSLTPHLPDELNPLLDRLTPLVACSKVGTFGKRPMDE